LLRPEDFAATMKRGRKSRDEYFSVFALPNTLAHSRIGLAVSRRASPKAVTRNRIKRQIREAFRRDRGNLGRFDIVVVAQTAAATAAGPTLQESLAQHWRRMLKRCEPS
jgi:ribonuclease P protein component